MEPTVRSVWAGWQCRAYFWVVSCQSRLLRREDGQDLIEYALMAATIAVAVGAIFPQTVAPNISTIFSKVTSTLVAANN